jgi:erythromycin esterase
VDETGDVAALRAHAIPLAGADPALPEDDLTPLLDRLAGARLVGLGEATHGDRESFRFKHRVLQALVRRRGFTVLLFERGPAEMDAYDRYVTGASATLPMGADLHPWRTEEVRDVFVWLRAWNRRQADAGRGPDAQVRVAGTSTHSWRGLPLALRLLDAGGGGATATPAWRRLAAEAEAGRYARLRDRDWVTAALAAWHAVPARIDVSDERGRWIALLAATFPQWLEVWSGRLPADQRWQACDRYLAETALAQLGRLGPARKAVLWAHNHHLWLEPGRAGRHLRAHLGPAYQTVYCAFGRGAYNAARRDAGPDGDWEPRPCPPPPPGSLEHLLDRLDLDCYAVAPAAVPAFRRELPVRHARMVVTEGADQFSLRCVPADWIDFLVYFREAHPTRPLGRPQAR